MKANEQGPGCVYIYILGAMGQAQVPGSPWVCPSTSIHGMNQPRVPDPSLIVHRSSELSRWRSMSDNITFDNCGGDFPLFLVEFMPPSSSSSQAFGGLRQRFRICISHPTNLMMLIQDALLFFTEYFASHTHCGHIFENVQLSMYYVSFWPNGNHTVSSFLWTGCFNSISSDLNILQINDLNKIYCFVPQCVGEDMLHFHMIR